MTDPPAESFIFEKDLLDEREQALSRSSERFHPAISQCMMSRPSTASRGATGGCDSAVRELRWSITFRALRRRAVIPAESRLCLKRPKVSDQVRHLLRSEARPHDIPLLHAIQHSGAVAPQHRDHGDVRIAFCLFAQGGSATRRIVVAPGTALFGEHHLSAGRVSTSPKILPRPNIAEDLPH